MNKNLTRIPLLLLALSASPWLCAASADGKTIAMQGNGKGASACIACHGPATDSMVKAMPMPAIPTWPVCPWLI